MGLKGTQEIAKKRNGCPASMEARDSRLNILRAVSKYAINDYNQKGEEGRVFFFLISKKDEVR
jgi:hypothetical protein